LNVSINGEPRDLAEGTTIASLLDDLQLRSSHVAVEVNRQLVPRGQHSEQPLREGDQVEVVTLVGGG